MTTMTEENHVKDALLAHGYRLSLPTAPRQSNFRVVAVVFYDVHNDDDERRSGKGERRHVVGSNDEPCHMSGSICAERAALVQLRFVPSLRRIAKVVISTDAVDAVITPGLLCREFMASHVCMPWDAPIVLVGCFCISCHLDVSGFAAGANDGRKDGDDDGKRSTWEQARINVGRPCPNGGDHNFVRKITTVAELYPFPSIYVRLTAKEAASFGRQYAEQKRRLQKSARNGTLPLCTDCTEGEPTTSSSSSSSSFTTNQKPSMEDAQRLITMASKAAETNTHSLTTDLHPIQYGAAVLFSDGTTATSHQINALEYGCTYDAVGQLANVLHRKSHLLSSSSSPPRVRVHPVLLAQADQYGVAHPPFAPARAFLSEHGFGSCYVAFHQSQYGGILESDREFCLQQRILVVPAMELAPQAPDMGSGVLNR